VRNLGPGAIPAARNLREESTPAEQALWQSLRGRKLDGLKSRRQQAMGPFILDFVCAENRLVIELDGNHHLDDPEQARYDAFRTAQLEEFGYHVIRFSNQEVLNNHDQVLQTISRTCRQLVKEPPLP
jgi:very-short-patch-repair endonuclease